MAKKKPQLPAPQVERAILTIRDQQVVIDADLAEFYGVETRVLNQAVRRNPERFPTRYMFELSDDEKQEVITECDHLERLKFSPANPKAFTEHGVLMAATVLNSDRAVAVSLTLVNAFVRLREIAFAQRATGTSTEGQLSLPAPSRGRPTSLQKRIDNFLNEVGPKLEIAVNHVLDTVINPKEGTTIRQEAEDLIQASIGHLKARLKKAGLENEEIAARVAKLLAEAESRRQEARKSKAQAEQIEFTNLVRRLRLVLAAQRTLTFGDVDPSDPVMAKLDAFEQTLKELAGDE